MLMKMLHLLDMYIHSCIPFFQLFSFVGEKNGIFSNLSLVDSIWHHHLIGLGPKKSIEEDRVSGFYG